MKRVVLYLLQLYQKFFKKADIAKKYLNSLKLYQFFLDQSHMFTIAFFLQSRSFSIKVYAIIWFE